MSRVSEYKYRAHKLDDIAYGLDIQRYRKHRELEQAGYHVMSKHEFMRRAMEDLGNNAKDRYDEAGI